ncbi:hypothetical protein DERF_003946 [Dermatophagoides farinae]|uniref:Uncharacterized protein n=1 Tax=Dermatophagoides farinae TaxID=6954 RepID=A0A922IGG9_DERFA|nr:hypothetical protein DERF_003946 [Dermatophagoides farinae]
MVCNTVAILNDDDGNGNGNGNDLLYAGQKCLLHRNAFQCTHPSIHPSMNHVCLWTRNTWNGIKHVIQ